MAARYIWPILAAALIGGPAFAQTQQPETAPPEILQKKPAEPSQGSSPAPEAKPEATLSGAGDIIVEQQEGQVLTDAIIGKTVVGLDGQEIGEVSGLILEQYGQVSGLLVATGGVLGIGAKEVAVAWPNPQENLAAVSSADQIALPLTKEEIATFPAFMSLADMRKLEEQELRQERQESPPPPSDKPPE